MGKLLLALQVVLFSSSVIAENNGSFPSDFLFGVGTSAYQIEGGWNEDGKGENIWDRWIHENVSRIADNETADDACNSFHLYKNDIAVLQELNVSHYQFSISWSRILPNGNDINLNGILYYKALIAAIIDVGVIPVATLYHFDLPQPLQDIGGWMNPEMVEYFLKYAKTAFQYFDNVEYWLTFNNPRATCRSGYGDGTYAPGIALDGIGEYLCAYVLLKSHAAAYHLYKNEYSSRTAKISIAIDLEWSEPASNSTKDAEAAERRNLFEFGLYADPIYKGNWPQVVIDRVGDRSRNENFPKSRLPEFDQEEINTISGTSDFMAVNMFTTYLVEDIEEPDYGDPHYESDMKVKVSIDPNWQISSDGKPIVPLGARKSLIWLKNTYSDPKIFITGNGVSNFNSDAIYDIVDSGRVEFYNRYLDAILDAMYEDNVNVFGYTYWDLLDCFEWTKGYSKPYGLYAVYNHTNPGTRLLKFSAITYTSITSSHQIHDPPATTTSIITTSTTPATTTPDSASQITVYPLLIFITAYLSYLLI